MALLAEPLTRPVIGPVCIEIESALEIPNPRTVSFQVILAIPHFLLVGGPIGAPRPALWNGELGTGWGGVPGAVAVVCALLT